MGRAKIILSQVRAIEMSMSAVSIQYIIPLHSESSHLGELRSINTKDGKLIVTYESLPSAKEATGNPIVFEKVEREIRFD